MFSRIFTYSIKNIFRNKFLSFSSILVIMLLMFFINILLVIQNVSFKLIKTVNDKWTIALYLKDKYDKNSIEVVTLMNGIKKISDSINVNYRDKWDALEIMRTREPDLVKIIERSNPLPNAISISGIWIAEYWAVNYLIQSKLYLFDWNSEWVDLKDIKVSDPKWAKYSTYNSQYKKIIGVIDYLVVLRISLYIIIWMFLFSISIIIYSIIWNFIYHYKDEIYITRLVWGSKVFIYWPFWIQGVLYALMGAILWIVLFYSGLEIINLLLDKNYDIAYIIWEYKLIFLLEIIVLMSIGWISWFISSRKYLNNN